MGGLYCLLCLLMSFVVGVWDLFALIREDFCFVVCLAGCLCAVGVVFDSFCWSSVRVLVWGLRFGS